jgi:predicted amidohydrolase
MGAAFRGSKEMTNLTNISRMLACCLLAGSGFLNALDRDVIISAYQGPCKDGDFAANLATARKAVQDALGRGSDFLVMPETFLSGYDTREHMEQGSRPIDDPQLAAFIAESSTHSMVVVIGLARKTSAGIYNTALVIHRGHLLGMYDKMFLTGGDRNQLGFLPGSQMPVFEANGARFAVIICHDSSFPYPALIAKLKGAEILFSPHYNNISVKTMDAHRKWVRNCHIGLACQMKMVVVRSNIVMQGQERLGYGDSFVVSPRGEMLAEAGLFRQEMITAKITPSLFQSPYVWADFKETPGAVKEMLIKLLSAPE